MALIKDKDAHLLLMANVAKEIQKHARDRQDYTLKGGTALLLCYNLNRFSTDLDFDSKNKLSEKNIVDAFHKASNSLPHRQLRKACSDIDINVPSSLPHRQFRNLNDLFSELNSFCFYL